MHAKEFVRCEGGSIIMSNHREIEVSRRRKQQFISKSERILQVSIRMRI